MKPTIKDIAKKAGVSPTSVSLVLNGKPNSISRETKEKILSIAKELNYRPNYYAQSLKTNISMTIGLIIPTLTNPFFATLASRIREFSEKIGYTIITFETKYQTKDHNKILDLFLQFRVAGVILVNDNKSNEKENFKLLSLLDSQNFPTVVTDSSLVLKKQSSVQIDNIKGGYLATKHLLKLNHKRIGCYTGPHNISSTIDRLKGYNNALSENSITNSYVFEGDYDLGLESLALEYFLSNQCTSIFAFNDIMALGIYKVAKQFNVNIPNDISIIGYDNISLSSIITPELTTISQSLDKISENIINIMLKLINNPNSVYKIIIDPTLILRESTKAL